MHFSYHLVSSSCVCAHTRGTLKISFCLITKLRFVLGFVLFTSPLFRSQKLRVRVQGVSQISPVGRSSLKQQEVSHVTTLRYSVFRLKVFWTKNHQQLSVIGFICLSWNSNLDQKKWTDLLRSNLFSKNWLFVCGEKLLVFPFTSIQFITAASSGHQGNCSSDFNTQMWRLLIGSNDRAHKQLLSDEYELKIKVILRRLFIKVFWLRSHRNVWWSILLLAFIQS